MKINSDHFLNSINNERIDYKFILFYGSNHGLVDLLFKTSLKKLSIDTNDPFIVSKLDTQNLIDNPSSLSEALSTYSLVSDKKTVLLDLCNYSLTKKIIDILISTLKLEINNYNLFIKADNLRTQSDLVKFVMNSKLGLLVPCYEETSISVKDKLLNIFNENNLQFNHMFISEMTSRFSSDTSINQMEFDKLKTFLINNDNVDQITLLNLINDNTDINVNKVAIHCASGDVNNALLFYEKAIQSAIPPIVVIRNILKYFKMIENILCLIINGDNIDHAMNSLKPPVFFKDKPHIVIQTKLWTIKKINLVKKRLIDSEIKCKSNIINDKLLIAQLILSISVIAKNSVKS
ncbi:hypothetical protein N9835_01685 [Alphaproteobacteria bacterium]|nr:hypothetical protein [Alphaproteobacteria bacterium]